MVLVLRRFLDDDRVVSCKGCRTHFTFPESLISKEFQGVSGRAFLVNVIESTSIERMLTTGQHVIRDLRCIFCKKKVGWKYISASEVSQEYKVGHSILERAYVDDVENEFSARKHDAKRSRSFI